MKRVLALLLAFLLCIAGAAYAAVPVDLNTATQAQLETIKGIGPVKAKALIDYRSKNGPFRRLEDVEKVKGFGKKTVEKLRTQVSVGGTTAGRMTPTRVDAGNRQSKTH